MKKIIACVIAVFFCFILSAKQVPTKLYPDRAVQDYVGLLSEQEQAALNLKLKNYADSTSTGIVIVIVKEVEDNINYRATQILSQWGVGQKGKDNGVVLLMAVNQRQIAISTGYGIEDRLTDALSRRIINNEIIPYFSKKQYYKGFDLATSSIMKLLSGGFVADSKVTESFNPLLFFLVMLFFFILIALMVKGGNSGNNNGNKGGMDLTDFIILSQLGRSRSSGSFGGSFGSGGFGGFGGGMGGGGGASGSW